VQQISERERERRQRQSTQSKQDRILRDAEVGERTGLSRTTRWRLVRAGKFPAPVQLTEHARGTRESDVDAWIASRPPAHEEAAQ
jgi:prophage regulatory protein